LKLHGTGLAQSIRRFIFFLSAIPRKDEIELGTMLIDSNVLGSDGLYVWGSNLGASMIEYFGWGEDCPWWFKIKIIVIGEDSESFSNVFSINLWNSE